MYRLLLVCVVVTLSSAHGHGDKGHGAHGSGHKHEHASVTGQPSNNVVNEAGPVVTPSGTIYGTVMQTRRGKDLQAYRGIRYAEPPIGELRFQPPVLIEKYKDVVNASSDGPACPQPADPKDFIHEDCLRLNVYTPEKRSKGPLPVVVFFHSGGFYSVSGRSDIAGPEYLLDKDIVLVTLNYRLGSLGFLSTGDKLAPGNNGFKDQVAALRWVNRNIAAFGGDPNLVTISGYSAGSFSVMLHMISPMSKGLFHRAVSMSGSPISQVKIPHHQRHLAVKQAKLVNCPSDSSSAILNCLKTKNWKELGDSLLGFFEFGYDPVLIWVPIVEPDFGQERFLTMDPLEAIRQRKIHAVPFIVSQTQDEFFWKAFTILKNETLLNTMNKDWHRIAPISFFLPEPSKDAADRLRKDYLENKPLVNDTTSATALGKLYNDAMIGFGAHRMANLMARYSPQPVYYYEFSYIGNHSHYEDPVTKKPTGAAHHDDLIYLFSINYTYPLIEVSDSADSQTVDKMTTIMYNFAKHGDPNPRDNNSVLGTLSWPVMTPKERKYLRIDKEFSVHENLFEDRFKVWEDLYPIKE